MTTAIATLPGYDAAALYRAVASRDRRFDGQFVLGVTSTGIYCRPSCPARTPKPQNVRYFAVPAAAVAAGFRACRRCRPERVASWPHVADETGVVDRALTLIGQGVVDDTGVTGLAERLSVSERHLHRLLVDSVGTGALALAQTRRAQAARTLLEQTTLSVTDVAFASGFGSLRQFNDVMKAEYGASPSELRRAPMHPDRPTDAGHVALRLPVTAPWDGQRLLSFLGSRAISGVESLSEGRYVRTLQTGSGTAVVTIWPGDSVVHVQVRTSELSDVGDAMLAVRRLCDLSAISPRSRAPSAPTRDFRRWFSVARVCVFPVLPRDGKSWYARSSGSRCQCPRRAPCWVGWSIVAARSSTSQRGASRESFRTPVLWLRRTLTSSA